MAGMAVHCQCGPQESLTGFQKLLGADEFLAMLEGKMREASFFKVRSGEITVCM